MRKPHQAPSLGEVGAHGARAFLTSRLPPPKRAGGPCFLESGLLSRGAGGPQGFFLRTELSSSGHVSISDRGSLRKVPTGLCTVGVRAGGEEPGEAPHPLQPGGLSLGSGVVAW